VGHDSNRVTPLKDTIGIVSHHREENAVNNFGWLVLVVFALIWILNAFLRSNQEERNTPQRRADGRGPDRSGSRQKSEIEQFLEEVNRRRRQKMEGPPPRVEQPAPMPTPLATRAPRQASGQRAESRRQKPATRTRSIPERQPERPLLAEAVVVVDSPERPALGQAALGQLGPAQDTAAQLVAQATEVKPAPFENLSALLKSPEGLRAAFIMQVVLGAPRCHRPRSSSSHS
jgi:hypothetical protein